jgi:hypothetical protein
MLLNTSPRHHASRRSSATSWFGGQMDSRNAFRLRDVSSLDAEHVEPRDIPLSINVQP